MSRIIGGVGPSASQQIDGLPSTITSGAGFRQSYAGETTSITIAVPSTIAVGTLLSLLVADGFGYANSVTGWSDTQGNTYTLDSALNEADGDGSVFVASCLVTTELTTADTWTMTFNNGAWDHFYVVITPFVRVFSSGLDTAGTPHGLYNPGTLHVEVVGTLGDLAIGYAVFQHGPAVNDAGHGWAELFHFTDDPQNTVMGVQQVLGAPGTVDYDTIGTATDTGDGAFAAAVICTYH